MTTQAVERQKGRRNLVTGKKLTNGIDSLIFVVTSRRGLISATHAYYPVHVRVPPSTGHEGPDEE